MGAATKPGVNERLQEVVALVEEEVNRVNAGMASVEQVKKFRLIPKELDHEDGELTATQKVKRRVLEERFKDLVGSMYSASGAKA